MAKCAICGMMRKTMMACAECKRNICLNDMFVKKGLCYDCLPKEIGQKYEKDDYKFQI